MKTLIMRKYLFILLIFSFCIQGFCQTISINKNLKNIDDFKTVFSCQDSTEELMFSKMKIDYLESSRILLTFEKSEGYGGETIKILVDDKLKLLSSKFSTWSDNLDFDLIETETVENSKIVFNKNPFENGFDDFRGYFELSIKTERRYRNEPKEKAFVEGETYLASFKCD